MSGSRCEFCCRRSSKDRGSEKLPAGGYGIRPYVAGASVLDDPRPCGGCHALRASHARPYATLLFVIALPLLVVFAVVGALLPLLLPLALVAAAFCILKKA